MWPIIALVAFRDYNLKIITTTVVMVISTSLYKIYTETNFLIWTQKQTFKGALNPNFLNLIIEKNFALDMFGSIS